MVLWTKPTSTLFHTAFSTTRWTTHLCILYHVCNAHGLTCPKWFKISHVHNDGDLCGKNILQYPFKMPIIIASWILQGTGFWFRWIQFSSRTDVRKLHILILINVCCNVNKSNSGYFLKILVRPIPSMWFAWTKEVIRIFSKDIVPW